MKNNEYKYWVARLKPEEYKKLDELVKKLKISRRTYVLKKMKEDENKWQKD